MGKSRLTLKYGERKTAVTVNERNLIQVIQPNEIEAGDEEGEIIHAMQHPIATPTFNEIVLARIFALRSRFGR
ncbi:MAG: lactate racemase domain-containing protein, partial [Halobacteriota archaeon]